MCLLFFIMISMIVGLQRSLDFLLYSDFACFLMVTSQQSLPWFLFVVVKLHVTDESEEVRVGKLFAPN